MASRARLQWDGDKLIERVTEAARAAVNETLRDADTDASLSHWWQNRTTNLEHNIVVEEAKVEGTRIVGSFGTTHGGKGVRSGFYGLFLEYRTPFLRPAADRVFPTLAARIRRRLR